MTATKLEIDDSIIKNQLLLNDEDKGLQTLFPSRTNSASAIITPKAGLCVKTKNTETGEKVFINVCTSETVPAPEDITSEQLIAIFESENPSDFKIPMSLGPLHQETDKGGSACGAYDVIINPTFLDRMEQDPLFHTFFMVVTIEGVADKYEVDLDKNCWTVLKNKKYHGALSGQTVRTTLPLIQELSGVGGPTPRGAGDPPLIAEVASRKLGDDAAKETPHVVVRRVPGGPGSVVEAEVHLPREVSAAGVRALAGADRFVVESQRYFLDRALPFAIDGPSSRAFFVRPTRVLVLRMATTTS